MIFFSCVCCSFFRFSVTRYKVARYPCLQLHCWWHQTLTACTSQTKHYDETKHKNNDWKIITSSENVLSSLNTLLFVSSYGGQNKNSTECQRHYTEHSENTSGSLSQFTRVTLDFFFIILFYFCYHSWLRFFAVTFYLVWNYTKFLLSHPFAERSINGVKANEQIHGIKKKFMIKRKKTGE